MIEAAIYLITIWALICWAWIKPMEVRKEYDPFFFGVWVGGILTLFLGVLLEAISEQIGKTF